MVENTCCPQRLNTYTSIVLNPAAYTRNLSLQSEKVGSTHGAELAPGTGLNADGMNMVMSGSIHTGLIAVSTQPPGVVVTVKYVGISHDTVSKAIF